MSDSAGRTPAHSSRDPRRYPWQVRDSGQLLLVVAAGVWLVAAVAQTAAEGLRDPRIAIAFGALIAFGEVLRSEEHTSELQSHVNLVCRLLLEKKKTK